MDNDEGDEEISSYPAKICEVIAKYVDNPLELSTFATGGEIDPFTLGIPAVVVKNVGRVAYPLCVEQSESLMKVATQAPFGHGTETVLDVSVRKAWQIDSDLVVINQHWLNNSLPKIVADCCTKLGVDGVKLGVRANLYKMLLYTEGGHFKRHKDTEKEPGMFGSLLIQLPADHEGGSLVVEHDGKSKRFEFAKDSADKAFYSSFYADCDHVLEPVTKGMRLVLAFNLVRGVESAEMSSAAIIASHRESFEEALVSAAKQWSADAEGVEKFVYPLAFQYTQTNISFAGLKGNDQKIVRLLQNAADPETGEKLFSVYLALVTKHVSGMGDEDEGIEDDEAETDYDTVAWVGPNGVVDFGSLSVDIDSEIITVHEADSDEDSTDKLNEICTDIFGEDPDRTESEGYMGNYPGTVEYWYNSAVLVFWPAVRDFDIKLSSNYLEAVALLRSSDRTTHTYAQQFAKLLNFLSRQPAVKLPFRDLISLAHDVTQVKAVFKASSRYVIGEDDCRAVVAVVAQYGLAALSTELSVLLVTQSLKSATFLLQLMESQSLAPYSSSTSSVSAVTAPVPTLNDLVDIVLTKSMSASKWSVNEVLGVTRTLAQAKLVLSKSTQQLLSVEDRNAIVTVLSKFGLPALFTEFSALLKASSAKVATSLLRAIVKATPFPPISFVTAAENESNSTLMNSLVEILVEKVVSSTQLNWSVSKVLSLLRDIKQLKAVLTASCKLVLTEDDCRAVVTSVSQYGWAVLSTDILVLMECQPLNMAIFLLKLVETQSLVTGAATSEGSVAVEQLLNDLADIVVRKIVTSKAWRISDVLPITRNVRQVQCVINASSKRALSDDDCHAIVATMSQYGFTVLTTEFSDLLKTQSVKIASLLLQMCLESTSLVSTSAHLFSMWVCDLADRLVISRCADSSDADLAFVCTFIVTYCDMGTLEQIAQNFGRYLQLKSLNYLIKTVIVNGSGDFIKELQRCAVLQCVQRAQPIPDLIVVVDWVVRGRCDSFMDMLSPKLHELCNKSQELFRALIAVPSVVAELKQESHISTLLENIVQSRISALTSVLASHKASWCMPAAKYTTGDPRVDSFLVGPEQHTRIYGYSDGIHIGGCFSGISDARSWTYRYFGYNAKIEHVTATASGAGKNAFVTLSKQSSFLDAVAQQRARKVNELNNMKRLLKIRSVPSQPVANLAAVTTPTSAVAAGTVGNLQLGGEQKRQKVEREVVEID